MTSEERLLSKEFDDVKVLTDYSYADALIGITEDNRAVYDYDKMVEWLVNEENFTEEDAAEWINFNTIRAIPYLGENAPLIMYSI